MPHNTPIMINDLFRGCKNKSKAAVSSQKMVQFVTCPATASVNSATVQ